MRLCTFFAKITLMSALCDASSAVQYIVTNVGTGPNGNGVTAFALNDNSQIAGADGYPGAKSAFLWNASSGVQTAVPGAAAFGMNDNGQLVGAFIENNALTHAFVWSQGEGAIDIGTLGGSYSEGYGINNAGQVVGRAFTSGNVGTFAFLWSEGEGMRSLGSLTGTVVGTSEARGINEAGQVVGWTDDTAPGSVAFIWSETTGMVSLGDFGTPNRHGSSAYAINDLGHVVGDALTESDANAFFWSAATGMKNLGTLPGHSYSRAFDINNAGQIVGLSYDNRPLPPPGPQVIGPTAIIVENGVMKNLNDLIPANSGWFLQEAVAINEFGQIAGNGRFNGDARSFLLTPIPEPSNYVTGVVGLLTVLGSCFKRQTRFAAATCTR